MLLEEIARLNAVFEGKVPEMVLLIESLRKYVMNGNSFEDTHYLQLVNRVLQNTPNATRLKLNLPFQVVGDASRTATSLLANTLACVAHRPEESNTIDTFVLDHVSDRTINTICNNPIDLDNAFKTFQNLKSLVMSIKRQEALNHAQTLFSRNLWFLIRKAVGLESLCIIGWIGGHRNIKTRRHTTDVPFNEWTMRSLPYFMDRNQSLNRLRCLELKRVDIEAFLLERLIEENCNSLEELYFNEVYLKVFGSSDLEKTALWIGHPDIPQPDKCCWLAKSIRNMAGLNLKVLRATGIGYDDFDPDKNSPYPNYDLTDPTGEQRSFDQRFVEAAMGIDDSFSNNTLLLQPDDNSTPIPIHNSARRKLPPIESYDAETFQLTHNTTSQFKRCIDGVFFNHNEGALKELQRIISVADRSMTLISMELDRTANLQVDHGTGILTPPPDPPST